MSKYLFHVLIGLDAAFPLHLSWLQLEAAEMTSHVHILDTRCSQALSNSNRQEGGKGNSVLPPSCTSYLTSHLFLNEPVTAVRVALRVGCTSCSAGDSHHKLMCPDPQACGETKSKQRRMAEDCIFLFEQDRVRTYVEKPWRCYQHYFFHSVKHNLSKPEDTGQLASFFFPLCSLLTGFYLETTIHSAGDKS